MLIIYLFKKYTNCLFENDLVSVYFHEVFVVSYIADMSKPKSHKGLGDEEWMSRLRRFANTGVWPSEAGNRPAPRQKKWYELFQRVCTGKC